MPTRRRILGHWPLTAPSAVHLTTCFSPDSQHCGLSVEALLPLSPLQRFNLFNYGCSITPRDWNVKKIFDGRFVPPLRWAGGALADRNGVFPTQSHSRTLYILFTVLQILSHGQCFWLQNAPQPVAECGGERAKE